MSNDVLVLDQNNAISVEVANKIIELEKKKKEIEDLEEKLKKAFCDEMRERKLKTVSFQNVSVTFVAGTNAERFDKKKFRQENEDLYNKYVSFGQKTADYVKINIKEKK